MTVNDPKVIKLAQAISKAEGFGPAENLPTRINNPCDLEFGDKGHGVEAGKTIFATLEEGWQAGYEQAYLILSGKSHVYSPADTLLQIAQKFTGGDDPGPWAYIVGTEIGVAASETLESYAAS